MSMMQYEGVFLVWESFNDEMCMSIRKVDRWRSQLLYWPDEQGHLRLSDPKLCAIGNCPHH